MWTRFCAHTNELLAESRRTHAVLSHHHDDGGLSGLGRAPCVIELAQGRHPSDERKRHHRWQRRPASRRRVGTRSVVERFCQQQKIARRLDVERLANVRSEIRVRGQGFDRASSAAQRCDQPLACMLVERPQLGPAASDGDCVASAAVAFGVVEEPLERQREAPAKPGALGFEPKPQRQLRAVVGLGEEIALPPGYGLTIATSGDVTLEQLGVELDVSHVELHGVGRDLQPIPNEAVQLEQRLTQRMPSSGFFALAPQERRELRARDGTRCAPRQVCEQQKWLAPPESREPSSATSRSSPSVNSCSMAELSGEMTDETRSSPYATGA